MKKIFFFGKVFCLCTWFFTGYGIAAESFLHKIHVYATDSVVWHVRVSISSPANPEVYLAYLTDAKGIWTGQYYDFVAGNGLEDNKGELFFGVRPEDSSNYAYNVSYVITTSQQPPQDSVYKLKFVTPSCVFVVTASGQPAQGGKIFVNSIAYPNDEAFCHYQYDQTRHVQEFSVSSLSKH